MTPNPTPTEIRAQLELAEETLRKLYDEREELERRIREERFRKSQLNLDLQEALRREAEERERNKLAPNFDDPWLKDFLAQLRSHPCYSRLRQFQKEDVVNLAWKLRTGNFGLINANDMGLGKTAETVVLLSVLASKTELLTELTTPNNTEVCAQ